MNDFNLDLNGFEASNDFDLIPNGEYPALISECE